MEPVRIFVGWDDSETVAWHVLAHSILRHATVPVAIAPLRLGNLRQEFQRERHPLQSTDFSFSRFLVPYLSGYVGTSVFFDCDMLVTADIANLVSAANPFCPVSVVPLNYEPAAGTKMLGQVQAPHPRSERWGNTKCWSSVMVFQNSLCKSLTPSYVEGAPGLALHQFEWVGRRDIGWLPEHWNWLATPGKKERKEGAPSLIHWTEGGPWWQDYQTTPYAELWQLERDMMLYAARKA